MRLPKPVRIKCTIATLPQTVVFIALLPLMGTNPLLGVSIILEAGMVPMSLFSESAKLCTEHLLCCRVVVSGILYVAKLIYL